MDITWHLKAFKELTTDELWDIYRHRIEIFVVEQNRAYEEVDDVDKYAYHLWATNEDDEMIAYTRFYREKDYISFGRVLTSPITRGTGMGRILMHELLSDIQKIYPDGPVKIHAQADKQGFYEKFGFVAYGDLYTHIHTPHIFMAREHDFEK